MNPEEIELLSTQLDELLSEGIDDPDEALEVAAIAGMLTRAGADAALVKDARAWTDGPGDAVLEEAWALVDVQAYLDAIDALAGTNASDDEVEEALLDFDELVAAASWCGQLALVREAATQVEATVRMMPETFASAADYGHLLARLPEVAMNLDLYGFWLAVADAGAYADPSS